jgi:hypothetical protein
MPVAALTKLRRETSMTYTTSGHTLWAV